MKQITFMFVIILSSFAESIHALGADDHEKDRAGLLAGVSEIAAPGVPGPLVIVDDNAFAVVAGAADRGIMAPVVAAGKCGAGRVVVFGHTGYADGETLAKADTRTLITNVVKWVSRNRDSKQPTRVGVFSSELGEVLKPMGYNIVLLTGRNGSASLDSLDVLYMSQRNSSKSEIDAIRKHIRAGGGLVACGLGWGWLQLNPGKSLDVHPLNRILDGTGIYIADGTLDRTGKIGFDCSRPLSPFIHAMTAVDAIVAGDLKHTSNDEMRQASWTASSAIRALPQDDKLLRPKLHGLQKDQRNDFIPTEKKPITSADGVARLLLTMQIEELRKLPPDRVTAHPAAREFPGEVAKDAKEFSRKLEIDCDAPDWHSTGLYAAPGRFIRIDAPKTAVNAGLRVRIGAHKDELWHLDKWSRVPEITLEAPLGKGTTTLSSPFGGPVYVVVPKNCKLKRVEITIGGAVEMPRFILGTTTLSEWKPRIRSLPAPWGELETSKVILTLPSRVLRDLDDPETLMKFWDRILDAHATLATIPLERKRPERMVADVQISAGYMHSGYPIMTHLDVDRAFIDVEALRRGEGIWGFVHELGHNHQEGDWTFDGTGEVTCNLFSLHTIDTVCKPAPGKRGHDAVEKPPDVAAYLKRGAKFDEWKRDPFLALQMYVQLEREFGWETFKRVFAEYRGLSKDERPRNDAEKRDQWMVRFSRTCGKNLGPFFKAWGVPTSDAARKSIADLPEWMPAGFPK